MKATLFFCTTFLIFATDLARAQMSHEGSQTNVPRATAPAEPEPKWECNLQDLKDRIVVRDEQARLDAALFTALYDFADTYGRLDQGGMDSGWDGYEVALTRNGELVLALIRSRAEASNLAVDAISSNTRMGSVPLGVGAAGLVSFLVSAPELPKVMAPLSRGTPQLGNAAALFSVAHGVSSAALVSSGSYSDSLLVNLNQGPSVKGMRELQESVFNRLDQQVDSIADVLRWTPAQSGQFKKVLSNEVLKRASKSIHRVRESKYSSPSERSSNWFDVPPEQVRLDLKKLGEIDLAALIASQKLATPGQIEGVRQLQNLQKRWQAVEETLAPQAVSKAVAESTDPKVFNQRMIQILKVRKVLDDLGNGNWGYNSKPETDNHAASRESQRNAAQAILRDLDRRLAQIDELCKLGWIKESP